MTVPSLPSSLPKRRDSNPGPNPSPTARPTSDATAALAAALDAAVPGMSADLLERTLEEAPAPETPAPEPPPSDCPKCGNLLADPAGLGWCAKCGYCRSLADEKKLFPQPSRGPSLGGMVEAGGAIKSLPLWFWVSGLVLAIGITISIFADKRLPLDNNFDRALWATLQVAVGVAIIFLAQFLALVNIAPEDPKLTFKDALAPFRLWPLVCKRLPRMQGALWSAIFGLSLIIGSAAFIGGFAHWLEYLPNSAASIAARKREAADKTPLIVPVD